MYGATYLPRKFKVGFALPPSNDVDVFSQDLGFIAIVENGKLAGYNVTVGGGLGMSHGNEETFPRLADRPRLHPRRQGHRHRRGRPDHAARLRRPDQPQTCPPQVHHRGPRRRLVQGRGGKALGHHIRRGASLQFHHHRRPARLASRSPDGPGSTASTFSADGSRMCPAGR